MTNIVNFPKKEKRPAPIPRQRVFYIGYWYVGPMLCQEVQNLYLKRKGMKNGFRYWSVITYGKYDESDTRAYSIEIEQCEENDVPDMLEAFDLGNMWFGAQLYKEGLLSDPPMFQMCLGIPWGAPATTLAMQAMKEIMPKEGIWSGFAISKNEMPFVAQTVLMGGNPRVGLEDNLYLSKGKLATNAQLVEKAIRIIDELGYSTMTPAETREKLKLVKHK